PRRTRPRPGNTSLRGRGTRGASPQADLLADEEERWMQVRIQRLELRERDAGLAGDAGERVAGADGVRAWAEMDRRVPDGNRRPLRRGRCVAAAVEEYHGDRDREQERRRPDEGAVAVTSRRPPIAASCPAADR